MRLSLSEPLEVSLSEIAVLAAGGDPVQRGPVRRAGGDPLTLEVPLRRLGKGVYNVSWKVISAVDGHLTEGGFAFGVGVSPGAAADAGNTAGEAGTPFELLARWLFLLGVVALTGGAVAGVARFGGTGGGDLALAASGWALAAAGLALLGEVQRSAAGSSLGELLGSSVGEALRWRAAALAAAGLALLVAWRAPRRHRPALAVATLAAAGVVLAHVEAGHAAAASWAADFAVPAQLAHFLAAGVWFGGLAALLLGFRGASTGARAAALRRFASLALASLLLVVATGVLRSVEELTAWGDLLHTGYGLALLAKLGLLIAIVAIVARSRPGRVAPGARELSALGRRARLELGAAAGALVLAALLGTLAPPFPAQAGPRGLEASGADFGHTVRVELATASEDPGPNLFTVRVEDYGSGEPLAADRVGLRFDPLDDLGIEPSTLRLKEVSEGTYAGSGPNLGFDGRWQVEVAVERAGDVAEIPLELALPVPEQFVSVLDIPGSPRPPEYTMQTVNGYIRISPTPERPGPSRIYVTTYSVFETAEPVDRLVVTGAPQGERPRQLPVRRLGRKRFVADAELEPGPMEIGVVGRTPDELRIRGVFRIDVPE